MKKLLIIVIATITSLTTFAQKSKVMHADSATFAKAKYSCPMHPDVTSDKPGKCSKCGMDLVKAKPVVMYSCPMHPDVTSDKPGKCSKCGMDLTKTKTKLKKG